ncbi:hypothetical protein PFFCH_05580 [Plasmodium falciparum FCH/4]|uniref:Plasmodium falciparum erythrocyte membrane protein 1 acidic terminal segment domain-containing protein n=1 Tax=Plasmodium falciparum FCH/4 TaxID=1036724 RepID=A0A024VE34_PLAFA|nr:hypothetical protein PFFCH_05580 [Plasmodium falciparum FCH/4]
MKVHYINILLFYLPLNILLTSLQINVHKHHYNTTHHTTNNKPTKSHRVLCECDIYTSIYDNDPEMKAVMQQFI